MSPTDLLKNVKERFPGLSKLPKNKLRLVEKALVYASKVSEHAVLLSEEEHVLLVDRLGGRDGITPGNSLKAYRLRAGLTQQELAKKSGVSQGNISAMEKGNRVIGLLVVKKLAAVLHCDYKKLL